MYEYIRYNSLLCGQIAIIHDDLTLTCALHILRILVYYF